VEYYICLLDKEKNEIQFNINSSGQTGIFIYESVNISKPDHNLFPFSYNDKTEQDKRIKQAYYVKITSIKPTT